MGGEGKRGGRGGAGVAVVAAARRTSISRVALPSTKYPLRSSSSLDSTRLMETMSSSAAPRWLHGKGKRREWVGLQGVVLPLATTQPQAGASGRQPYR